MHIHLLRYLAMSLMTAMVLITPAAAEPAATTAPASGPASAPAAKLHCVVLNEASTATPKTEIGVYCLGAAGWVPLDGETTGKGGACDLAFPGNTRSLLMLKVTAPGYKDAEVFYLPDPAQVTAWITITLKGAQQLTGSVVNGQDEPVAGAEVTIDMPAGPRRAKTDTDGRFALEELMPIRTTVRVEVPGVGSAAYRVDLTRKNDPLKIMLRPQRKVTLQIVDADKKPVPGLAVEILAPRKYEAQTDAEGRVQVPGISANATQIQVSLTDKFYCLDEPVMMLDVEEGTEPVELEMFAAHGGRICGQVVEMIDGQAQGIPAATVWLVERGKAGRNVECDEDGKFELDGVAADSYVVAAGHMTYATSLGRAEVEAGKEAKLQFTLGYGATIRGTVVDAQGKPAERAIVRVAGWLPKRPARGAEPEAVELPWRATRSGEGGGWMLEHLPAGRMTIEAVAENGSHRTVVNVQVPDGTDVIETKIVLQSGEFKPPL